jgi:hypothetical protein
MIAQPTSRLDYTRVPVKTIEAVLVKFIKSQCPGLIVEGERDMKGVLMLQANNTAADAFDSETNNYTAISMRWKLQDYDVENVIEVIKSKQYNPKDIWAKFNLKFLIK